MKLLRFILLLFIVLPGCKTQLYAQDTPPDTVRTGVYITSIHDIDFKQKEYALNLWIWFRYKRKEFDFLQNLEVPQAKSVTKSFSTIDTSDGEVYVLMKLDCMMKDSWRIRNFPFDRQKLRFSVENSQYDSKSLIFEADTVGEHFDKKYTLRGWMIDSLKISTGKKKYETGFGDHSLKVPRMEYSNFKFSLNIEREASGLFWKMFLGMYVAFIIAFMCFFIHADNFDSRFGLSVGALFAVVGNKYIIDSALPESNSFTLVDTLHGVTLLFILVSMICNTFSLRLITRGKKANAVRFDNITAAIFAVVYLAINAWYIYQAANGEA